MTFGLQLPVIVAAIILFCSNNSCSVSCFTPSLQAVNIAAAFDVLEETSGVPPCLTVQGLQINAAILMAVQELNSKTDGLYDDILPDVYINLTSYQYSKSSSTGLANKMIEDIEQEQLSRSAENSIVSCLGPTYHTLISDKILNAFSIANIGYSDPSLLLASDNFVRSYPSEIIQGPLLADLIKTHFGWKRVSVVFGHDKRAQRVNQEFQHRASALGLEIISTHFLSKDSNADTVIDQLRTRRPRIVLLLLSAAEMPGFIFRGVSQHGFQDNTQLLTWDMASAAPYFSVRGSNSATTSSSYSFLLSAEEELQSSSSDYEHLISEESRRQYLATSLKGLIGVKMKPVIDREEPTYTAFLTRLRALHPDVLLTTASNETTAAVCNITSTPMDYVLSQGRLNFSALTSDMLAPEALFAYDATIALAKALHYLLYESSHRSELQHNQDLLPSLIKEAFSANVSFAGVTGHVSYDADASRSADIALDVFNFHPELYLSSDIGANRLLVDDHELGYVRVGVQHSTEGFAFCNGSSSEEGSGDSGQACHSFVYNSADNEVVSDRPPLETEHMSVLASVILQVLAVIGVGVAGGCAYFIWYYENTRLVRVAQPFLSLLILTGCFFSFAASIVMSIRETEVVGDGLCSLGTWLQDMALIFILVPLFVKKIRINLILSASTKLVAERNTFSVSNKQGNIIAIVMVLGAVFFRLLSDHVICKPLTLEYTIIRDDQYEHTQEASCPVYGVYSHASPTSFSCYLAEIYVGILLCFCCALCFYRNRSDFEVEEADASVQAIATFVLAIILFITATVVIQILGIEKPSIRRAIHAIFFIVIPFRIMNLLYLRMWNHLVIENMDLDRKFQVVSRDSTRNNIYHQWVLSFRAMSGLTRRAVNGDFGGAGLYSPHKRGGDGSQAPLFGSGRGDEAVAPGDEREMIQAEIDTLCERLDFLANKELYNSTGPSQFRLKSFQTQGHLSMDGGGGTILPPAEGHSQTPSQGQDNNVATFSVPPPSQSHLHAQETGVEETPALELELKNVE